MIAEKDDVGEDGSLIHKLLQKLANKQYSDSFQQKNEREINRMQKNEREINRMQKNKREINRMQKNEREINRMQKKMNVKEA